MRASHVVMGGDLLDEPDEEEGPEVGRRGSILNDFAVQATAGKKRVTQIRNNVLNIKQKEMTQQERKVAEMAEIIQTYRHVEEMPTDKEEELWVDSSGFDLVFAVAILINTIVIGLEVDLGDPDDRHAIWYVLENIFCLIFIVEITLKVWYHTWRWPLIDLWNFFTLFVCIMACVDAWILAPLGLHGSLRMLSLLRVIGMARLLRVIHHYRNLKELRLVIQCLMGAIGMLTWTVLLLFIFLYVSAVFTTSQIGKNTDDFGNYAKLSNGWDAEEWFGTVGKSMITLLQLITRDSWSTQIARHVIGQQWYMAGFFILFLMASTYGLLNCVISVIVEQTLTAAKNNENRVRSREERQRRQELESIREIFVLADANGDGDLDLEEFLSAVTRFPEILWRLRQLDLPIDDATRLFHVIDEPSGSRSLTMTEFIEGCTKLKGPARSRDLLAIQAQADTLAKKMDMLGGELQDGERMLSTLDEISVRMTNRFKPSIKSSRHKIARNVGGSAPVQAEVALEKHSSLRGKNLKGDLSFGNLPILPRFPSLLN